MSMVFCRGCGKQIKATAAACPHCEGAQAGVAGAAAAARSNPQGQGSLWRRRFALIDKAGGPKLPNVWKLPINEVWSIKFNLWAFIFQPFYYAAKGMWKKGLTFLALSILIVGVAAMLLESMGVDSSFLLLVAPGIFSGQANVSYYKFIKLGHNRWW
jgi:hypothetical protein